MPFTRTVGYDSAHERPTRAGGTCSMTDAGSEQPLSRFHAVVYRDQVGEWRFRIVSSNGEPVAQSEGYVNRQDAERMALALVNEDEDRVEIEMTDRSELDAG